MLLKTPRRSLTLPKIGQLWSKTSWMMFAMRSWNELNQISSNGDWLLRTLRGAVVLQIGRIACRLTWRGFNSKHHQGDLTRKIRKWSNDSGRTNLLTILGNWSQIRLSQWVRRAYRSHWRRRYMQLLTSKTSWGNHYLRRSKKKCMRIGTEIKRMLRWGTSLILCRKSWDVNGKLSLLHKTKV